MTLIDDLHRIAAISAKKDKAKHIENSIWIFERNFLLPEQEIAHGLAFMVEDYLQEKNPEVKSMYLYVLSKLLESREEAGGEIDWDALIHQLPYTSSSAVFFDDTFHIVKMLGAAHDEKYLPVLEYFFDDERKHSYALYAWVRLARRIRYQHDWQVQPYLLEASKAIADLSQKSMKRIITLDTSKIDYPPMIREILQKTAEKISREVQLQPKTRAEVDEQYRKESPWYFPNAIRFWLAPNASQEKKGQGAFWFGDRFDLDFGTPADECAQVLKIVVDYALIGENLGYCQTIWEHLLELFWKRRYAGAYLEWPTLMEQIEQLEHVYQSTSLLAIARSAGIACHGYSNDTHYFPLLEGYLPTFGITAAKAILLLQFQLCHYAPPADLFYQKASEALYALQRQSSSEAPPTAKLLQKIHAILNQFKAKTHPYEHYYTI